MHFRSLEGANERICLDLKQWKGISLSLSASMGHGKAADSLMRVILRNRIFL